ncbi:E3 ubiquitin-protein ligase RLIM-like [Rattus norvegicus]|uniref:E3 ubiquitin-protein ligase RLIM-like n=1 Tax=Rattus norvegicus TaxID=10116 RepID=UPI0004E47F3C|nr:E3 ubiquitin-protein ligase RLIM-like [Rattus norvegicus]|eukprot:XP_006257042.2 PREDICTED: E3 ubiquitin-protein ligase RLIM-like isoform X2 [Rattus norvegicus]
MFNSEDPKLSRIMRCSHALLNVDGMTCLKVENLAYHTSSYTLKLIFEDYGAVGDVFVPRNHLTEENYGFAFIHFYNNCDAKDAMHGLHGILLDGNKLKVQMVHNDDLHYAQPDCGHGRQYHYEEENHELQKQYKRQHCSNTRIQTRSQSRLSPDNSESKSQSCNHSHRKSASTNGSTTQSSLSTQKLPNRACPKSRNRPGEKKKPKSKSSCKSVSKYPSGGGCLVIENMETKQNQVENVQSKSVFKKSCRSKGNAAHTLMASPSTTSQKRKRCRSPQNLRESPRLESGANTAHVLNSGDSERGQLNSLQQSEKGMKMGIRECGFWTAKSQSNPSNNDITGEVRFTFNKGNSNPQNDLSGLSCHDNNRKVQKQVDYQQPESTCVSPFTKEGNITEVLVEDTFSKDRSTRSKSPDMLILKETIESRLLPETKDMELVETHHCLSPETFKDLRKDEAYFSSNSHTFLPLRDDLNISELRKLYFFASFPTREHILTESTAHRSQTTSVTPTNFTTVEIDQKDTNLSSCYNQTGIQNSEKKSDEILKTNLDFTIVTTPCGTAGNIMTGVFEVNDNFTEIDLESCDSLASQSNRKVQSGHSNISSSVSITNSNSTSNSNINNSLLSLLNYSQQFLPVPNIIANNTIGNDINSPHTSQINKECDEFFLFHYPPLEARQQMHVISPEISNDSDSWPLLPDFSNFNDIHNNHPKGLTKEQINTLPVKTFCENDKLNHCSICITPYTQNSKIRVLPCFHEYHDKCIDRWLSDNSTCPICRKQIINPDDMEFLF